MASRGLRKTYFFSIWRLVRGETLIFVCFYGCIVCPLKTGLYKLSGRSGANQSFSSHKPSNEKKNMFFVIPEMPSKTFVMLKKKLPGHFNPNDRYLTCPRSATSWHWSLRPRRVRCPSRSTFNRAQQDVKWLRHIISHILAVYLPCHHGRKS